MPSIMEAQSCMIWDLQLQYCQSTGLHNTHTHYSLVSVFLVPRKCSVVGCRGNYEPRKGESADVNNVSVFRFPKDDQKKSEWLRRIPRDFLPGDITDDMVVCERHFEPSFIIRDYVYSRPDGSSFTCPRESPALDTEAVPTLFPNTPKYLSSPLPPKRKAPEERRAEAAARDEKRLRDWMDSDSIEGFDDFAENVSEKSRSQRTEWVVVNKTDLVLFVLLVNITSSLVPSVAASFKVFRNMSVDWFDDKFSRNRGDLAWLLGDEGKLSRWSDLPNLCTYVENSCKKNLKPMILSAGLNSYLTY